MAFFVCGSNYSMTNSGKFSHLVQSFVSYSNGKKLPFMVVNDDYFLWKLAILWFFWIGLLLCALMSHVQKRSYSYIQLKFLHMRQTSGITWKLRSVIESETLLDFSRILACTKILFRRDGQCSWFPASQKGKGGPYGTDPTPNVREQ